jgi:hypothetical protein
LNLLYSYATVKRSQGGWLLIIPRCPFCAKRHTHGGGSLDENPRRYLSSRVPHCSHPAKRFEDMYWLTDDAALHGQPVPESRHAEIGEVP